MGGVCARPSRSTTLVALRTVLARTAARDVDWLDRSVVRLRRSDFRLDDRQAVPARIDEPGSPGVAHVGDAVDGHRVGGDVILDPDAAGRKVGDRRVDVRLPPGHLGLRVAGPGGAVGEDQLGAVAAPEHDPVGILARDLEAERVTVEGHGGGSIERQQDREDGGVAQHRGGPRPARRVAVRRSAGAAARAAARRYAPCGRRVAAVATDRWTKDDMADDELADARAGLVMIRAEPFNAEAPPAALRDHITPTASHYVRSNFGLPEHDGLLAVRGAVDHEATLTVDDLRALPVTGHTVTLECAGNGRSDMRPLPAGEPWGGGAVSTAHWTGARLHDVLQAAGPDRTAREVLFAGADHGPYHQYDDLRFVRSLSLAHALDPAADILVAYEMNGEPLSADHGAPFRLVVPGWYAVASVKWLSAITVATELYDGEFQTGHYVYHWPDGRAEPVTLVKVRARITEPAIGAAIANGEHTIRGKAWSGHGPITTVEVSVAGDGEWQPAKVEPARDGHAWQEWSIPWDARRRGRHALRARATDADGGVQPDVPAWNRLGYGNNAVETVVVDVR